jgi:hypothetical protein
LPFSDAKMEFDPADLKLFDNGFLWRTVRTDNLSIEIRVSN